MYWVKAIVLGSTGSAEEDAAWAGALAFGEGSAWVDGILYVDDDAVADFGWTGLPPLAPAPDAEAGEELAGAIPVAALAAQRQPGRETTTPRSRSCHVVKPMRVLSARTACAACGFWRRSVWTLVLTESEAKHPAWLSSATRWATQPPLVKLEPCV